MNVKNRPAHSSGILLLAFSLTVASAAAQERTGAYFGFDLGVFFPQSIDTKGNDTDVVKTECDGFLYPASINTAECEGRGVDWTNRFDMDTGALAGLTVGYMMDSFRFELEYLYRAGDGETSSLGIVGSSRDGEFVIDDEQLSGFESHHLFASMYYDFLNGSKFTPYVGVGVGWAKTEVDYEGLLVRNSPDVFRNNPSLTSKLNAAGTVTRGETKLDDDGFGYQILVGADYWFAEHLSLGIKFRYAEFDGIDDERHDWDILRGHDSAIAPGGDRVRYGIESNDLRFWGASLNLKHRF